MTERLAAARDGQQITLADVETLCAALRDRGAVDEMPMWAHAGRRTQCWMLYGILHREYLAPGWDAAPGTGRHTLVREPSGALGWAWQPDTAVPGWQPDQGGRDDPAR